MDILKEPWFVIEMVIIAVAVCVIGDFDFSLPFSLPKVIVIN